MHQITFLSNSIWLNDGWIWPKRNHTIAHYHFKELMKRFHNVDCSIATLDKQTYSWLTFTLDLSITHYKIYLFLMVFFGLYFCIKYKLETWFRFIKKDNSLSESLLTRVQKNHRTNHNICSMKVLCCLWCSQNIYDILILGFFLGARSL